jgi:hypothetical protein
MKAKCSVEQSMSAFKPDVVTAVKCFVRISAKWS